MSSEARVIRQFAELVKAGHQIDFTTAQFSEPTRKDLEILIQLTRNVGGPLAATLDRFALVLLSREQSKTELDLAVAGPKASSRLVMSLPILVFVGAGIAGIPIFRVLSSPSIIWLSLLSGGLLFWWGSSWTNRLLRRAKPITSDPGFPLELLAIAAKAGLPLPVATATVEEILGQPVDATEIQDGGGIAIADLLQERATSVRQEQVNQDRLKIQKTSIAVLWPLGLTVLPAFVLIAIVPIGTALIQTQ